MLRLPSKLFMLRTIPNAHILSALQLRPKSDWFTNRKVQKVGFYGRVGPVNEVASSKAVNKFSTQPPNWQSNLKDNWDQLILEDKIKLFYYSIWAIFAGCVIVSCVMVGDTDDEVRKKDVLDEECKSSFVHEKEITADVNGLVEKSIEVGQKIDFVVIERKKLAKLIEQADAVADLHQVLFKAEQVLLKTSAEINNARKQLNKLDENQHAEAVIDNETVSDFSRCF